MRNLVNAELNIELLERVEDVLVLACENLLEHNHRRGPGIV